MRRQAFINWEKVTPDNKPENGKRYLLADVTPDNVAHLMFATWYDEGTVIQLSMKRSESFDELSAEERLLECIFGSSKDYTIKQSGFYEMTSEVSDRLEDGVFKDCIEMPVLIKEDYYFAEEPMVPAGCLNVEQGKKQSEIQQKLNVERHKQALIDNVYDAMEKDELIKALINAVIKDVNYDIYQLETHSCTLRISKVTYAEVIIQAKKIYDALMKIYSHKELDAICSELTDVITTGESVADYLAQLKKDSGIESEGYFEKYCLNMFFEAQVRFNDFYRYRTYRLKYHNRCTLAQNLTAAWSLKDAITRLARLGRLGLLGAPSIIMQNELRLFANALAVLQNARIIEESDFAENFHELYGIYVDGSEYTGKSDIGHFEREFTAADFQNESENEDDEDDGETVEPPVCECDECKCGEIPEGYVVAPSPNCLCMEGPYSLWNPKEDRYYRQDDKIVVFTSYTKADAERRALNG